MRQQPSRAWTSSPSTSRPRTRNAASVCQIGIAKIRDGQVIKQATSYVLPPPGHEHFADRNVAIHGITRRTLNNAEPDKIADWPSILQRISLRR
ncbi:hypothetical protein ACFVVC_01715 [Pseudarthrobacter sp. NPDC058196]|uniref:hypothetical protein n=1 Tax=Pseudarthrobacter sp. NPDC058196 TaxID=3346376 RepID=UPI0036DC941E